jgi:hypothetical protein
MRRKLALVYAIFIGFAAVAIPTAVQSHLQADSAPDLVCNLILAPGSLVAANLFHTLDTTSPEFLLLSRLVTFILFGGVAYSILRIEKPSI